jgi:hypothetical protein
VGSRQHMRTRGWRRVLACAPLRSRANSNGAARNNACRDTSRHEPKHRESQRGDEGAAPGPRRGHIPQRASGERRPAFRPLKLHSSRILTPLGSRKKKDLRVPGVGPAAKVLLGRSTCWTVRLTAQC